MDKYFKAFFDLTKLPTKFFFLFSAVSGFILFSNIQFLNEKLFLAKIKNDYGWILSIVFILSTGLVAVNLVLWVFSTIRNRILLAKLKKQFTTKLRTLDPHEKSVIREFVLRGQKSIDMPLDDPTVAGLLSNKILVMNRQFGNSSIMRGMDASLSLNEYAEKILVLSDIDLSQNPTEQEIEKAKNNRPRWTRDWRY